MRHARGLALLATLAVCGLLLVHTLSRRGETVCILPPATPGDPVGPTTAQADAEASRHTQEQPARPPAPLAAASSTSIRRAAPVAPARDADAFANLVLETRGADADFDIVYLWVNNTEPKRHERAIKLRIPELRMRDNGELFYSLRSLQQFMPWWKGTLYLVTTEVPCWLNTNHPRLVIVDHADIFPRPHSMLPMFNSQAIEANLHRIKGLKERFVLMNDDYFIAKPVQPSDFFHHGRAVMRFEQDLVREGMKDLASFMQNNPMSAWVGSIINSRGLLDAHYGVVAGTWGSPATSPSLFHLVKHAPVPMFKEYIAKMWQYWPNEMSTAIAVPIRQHRAVQVSYVHHAMCILERGPCDPVEQTLSDEEAKFLTTNAPELQEALKEIQAGQYKFFNINDEQRTNKQVQETEFIFTKFLPSMYAIPSAYEKRGACPVYKPVTDT